MFPLTLLIFEDIPSSWPFSLTTRKKNTIVLKNPISTFRAVPELHVHVHPAADAASVGDEAAPEGVQLPPAPRQARLLPRPHRQAHRRLQHHTHCRTSSQSR